MDIYADSVRYFFSLSFVCVDWQTATRDSMLSDRWIFEFWVVWPRWSQHAPKCKNWESRLSSRIVAFPNQLNIFISHGSCISETRKWFRQAVSASRWCALWIVLIYWNRWSQTLLPSERTTHCVRDSPNLRPLEYRIHSIKMDMAIYAGSSSVLPKWIGIKIPLYRSTGLVRMNQRTIASAMIQ